MKKMQIEAQWSQ